MIGYRKNSGLCMKLAVISVVLLLLTGAGVVAAQTPPPPPSPVTISFGTDIDRATRAVMGPGEVFPAEVGQVYCWTRVLGIEDVTTVTHAWYFGGKTMARVDLPVRSTDWRTWSSKTILPAWVGEWEVKILDAAGKVLAAGTFRVE